MPNDTTSRPKSQATVRPSCRRVQVSSWLFCSRCLVWLDCRISGVQARDHRALPAPAAIRSHGGRPEPVVRRRPAPESVARPIRGRTARGNRRADCRSRLATIPRAIAMRQPLPWRARPARPFPSRLKQPQDRGIRLLVAPPWCSISSRTVCGPWSQRTRKTRNCRSVIAIALLPAIRPILRNLSDVHHSTDYCVGSGRASTLNFTKCIHGGSWGKQRDDCGRIKMSLNGTFRERGRCRH